MIPKPLRIGLTGGIGSGKTTVSNMFSKLGVPIIDTDIIAREVVQPGSSGLDAIVAEFGTAILTPDNSLDRRALRKLIFKDSAARLRLNALLHPLIYQQVECAVREVNYAYCIICIPLLFETNGEQYVDRVLLIDTSLDNQLARSAQRDTVARSEVMKIIQTQMEPETRRQRADDIIVNDADLMHLEQQVNERHKTYLTMSRA